MKVTNIGHIENKRIKEQKVFDDNKSRIERNKLGQYATPSALALEIAVYLSDIWKKRKDKIKFLEPAIGTGSFYSALLQKTPNLIKNAVGIEFDKELANISTQIWRGTPIQIIADDFTKLNGNDFSKFNLILTNPPYIRHHHINLEEKQRLALKVKSDLDYKVNGLAGYYVYFLLLAHDWLEENGIGVWLIPSEFADVNYGSALRRYFTEKVTLIRVHRFDPHKVLFDDALVSSTIVVFQNKTPHMNDKALFTYGGTFLAPEHMKIIDISEINGGDRWGKALWTSNPNRHTNKQNDVVLSDLFDIRRGIATGANKFFILKREHASNLGIPKKFLRPILPSPRKLPGLVINADEFGYPIIDDQFELLDIDLPEEHIKKDFPEVWEYITLGEKTGISKRYLASKRKPWYKQEKREPSPFLCTYMGRGSSNDKNPFKFYWNKSKSVAPNTYLFLYPKEQLDSIMKNDLAVQEKIFEFLKNIEIEDLIQNGRVYGGGLHKLEPSELGRIPIKDLAQEIGYKKPIVSQPFLGI